MHSRSDKKHHIVVVDDDIWILDLLRATLEQDGFNVSACSDGREFWMVMERDHIDLVILDLSLPDEDGLTICRNLRSRGSIPIIILTSRSDDVERVIGLEMGADDYLVKPVYPRELLARIKGLLRRSQLAVVTDQKTYSEYVSFSGWIFDVSDRSLIAQSGEQIQLTYGEFRLLMVFINNPFRVLNRDQLLDLSQDREMHVFDRSIDNMVSRLRRRLQDNVQPSKIIQTVRGEGYRFNTKVKKTSENPFKGHFLLQSNIELKKTVLLSDDELIGIQLKSWARQLNIDLLIVARCEELVQIVQAQRCDIAFLDCHLNAACVYDISKTIRKFESDMQTSTAIPLIAVGSNRHANEKGHWLAAQMTDFLEKPVLFNQLQNILMRWLTTDAEKTKQAHHPPLDKYDTERLRCMMGANYAVFIESVITLVAKTINTLIQPSTEPVTTNLKYIERIWYAAETVGAKHLAYLCRILDSQTRVENQLNEQATLSIKDEWGRVCLALLEQLNENDD